MDTISRKRTFADHAYLLFQPPATSYTLKDRNIETLRGMAIILVVLGHMIGMASTGGMRVSDDSIYRYLYYSLEYIRLPLFTVISGWVYANKPVMPADKSNFIKGKFRRLIIPMLVAGTLLFLFRMIIPGTNTTPTLSALPRNLIFPYDVYWYLFALFIIFLVVSLVDSTTFFKTLKGWSVTLACAFVFLFISENFLDPVPNFFGFKGAAYLFPFFLLGIGLFRHREFLLNDTTTLLILVIFLISFGLQQLIWFDYFPMQHKHGALGMTVGISGVLLLFRLKIKNRLLILIGGYAYGIFLFHVFFTGGSRIVLTRLGLSNQTIMLVLGIIIAISASILVETLVKRSPTLRFFLLGLKKHERYFPSRRELCRSGFDSFP